MFNLDGSNFLACTGSSTLGIFEIACSARSRYCLSFSSSALFKPISLINLITVESSNALISSGFKFLKADFPSKGSSASLSLAAIASSTSANPDLTFSKDIFVTPSRSLTAFELSNPLNVSIPFCIRSSGESFCKLEMNLAAPNITFSAVSSIFLGSPIGLPGSSGKFIIPNGGKALCNAYLLAISKAAGGTSATSGFDSFSSFTFSLK